MKFEIKTNNAVLYLDENDRELLFEALCHYDMHNELNSKENDSFHYLYGELSPSFTPDEIKQHKETIARVRATVPAETYT